MNKFTYNQEQAVQVGAGQYVTKSGGYDFKIVRAQFSKGTSNQSESLEFDFEDRNGLKCNYVSINYTKGNGEPNEYGHKLIQSIMGCVGAQNLTENQTHCPELFGKYIKAVVQRIDYTKQSGAKAGQDGYKFDFKLPANMQTGKTVKEQLNNEPATSFDQYASTITDKDERTTMATPQAGFQQSSAQQAASNDFDDDIPFAPIGLQHSNHLMHCI